MKVLVTGANGFLGRQVVAQLLGKGHAVRALVRPATRLTGREWPGEVDVFRGDLRVARDLPAAFEGVDVLVHLAAAVSGGEEAQFAAGVVGTEKLLAAMAESETKRLVLAGSFSVYDWKAANGTLDESSPLLEAPGLYERDGYAVAKVWQERVVRKAAEQHGWMLTVLRPGFIWGRGNEYLACLGQKFGKAHVVFGPNGRIPLTHVENCASAFALAAESPKAAGETFNVIDGDEVRIGQYLRDHLRHSGQRGVRVPIPYFVAITGVRLSEATSKFFFKGKGKLPGLLVPCRFEARFKPLRFSNLKLREVLGWEPKLSYEEALTRTYGPEGIPDHERAASPVTAQSS